MPSVLTSPPDIKPLPPAAERPLWSVMIPVYNCSQYLPETLESVLVQVLSEGDMQIEVVDDASSDVNVAALVEHIGKGRVKYFRQPENVGSLRNFETCINRAQGKLVHILHGDDRVKPGFYEELGKLLKANPEAGAAFCRYSYINSKGEFQFHEEPEMRQEGILPDWLMRIAERQVVQYVAMVVRREVYEKLGSFYGATYGEDWEMWVRIARYYPVAYTPSILAEYRLHLSSISGQKFLTGQTARDLVTIMALIQEHIPVNTRNQIRKKSCKFYAHHGLYIANHLWHETHNKQWVKAQFRQSLSLHQDWLLYLKILKVQIKMFINRV